MIEKVKKAFVGSSLFLALFHFVCCGVPALSALLNAGMMTAMPKQTLLSHHQMGYMLYFSGALLLLSFYFVFSKKCCCVEEKHISFMKIILFVSLVLYGAAVYFHIEQLAMPMEHAMH